MKGLEAHSAAQRQTNDALLAGARYLDAEVESRVLPLRLDLDQPALAAAELQALEGLEIDAARTAISSLAALAQLGETDHLGGGLELIPSLLLTLGLTDYEAVEFTIEHAHTSIGYYAALAALGFLDRRDVVGLFRRGIDIPGHVSWVPGGTQLNGGRLGVMIPVAVGQALGKRALYGDGGWVIAHCGDAGWISGQALNGFNAADVHGAPITFVMHRNGIQLSGTTKSILDKDPRALIEALGIEIIELASLHDRAALFQAYRHGRDRARSGRPSLIYPTGQRDSLESFGQRYGVEADLAAFAQEQGVALDTQVWIPGSLMSYRDAIPMIECLFLVNDLSGGVDHHDGNMKGRDEDEVLAHPVLQVGAGAQAGLDNLRAQEPRTVVSKARPAPGSANLILKPRDLAAVALPGAGDKTSPRTGSEAAYLAVAQSFADRFFIVSCDLDPSTKLGKARALLAADHGFEMSIEEQAATLLADGLACSSPDPQFNVVSTFAAFFEGIAREGFDMWRYQRNLNGPNEGLNVVFHLSHVGACTGRDHFSGWGLDWINVGLTYLPYLHRFYTPADARSAFLAVVDAAAHYGGHIVGIPRDDLPILTSQDGTQALWTTDETWSALTQYRAQAGARRAILAVGAPAFLGAEAAAALAGDGLPTDVFAVNGLPLPEGALQNLIDAYGDGLVTIEDGLIGTPETGVRGFAGLVSAAAYGSGTPLAHLGITDPRTAPSQGHMETWAHFGITAQALEQAVRNLAD